MYYKIQQVEGRLADAAKSILGAVKAGNLDLADKILRDEVGRSPDFVSSLEKTVWFATEAPDACRGAHGLTVDDWRDLRKCYGGGRQMYEAAARLAERYHGGKWIVVEVTQ